MHCFQFREQRNNVYNKKSLVAERISVWSYVFQNFDERLVDQFLQSLNIITLNYTTPLKD